MTTHPTLSMGGSNPGTTLRVPCSPALIVHTRDLLLGSVSGLSISQPCHFSVISIRQRLVAGLNRLVRHRTTRTFEGGSRHTFALRSKQFLRVLTSVSGLLHAHDRCDFSH